MNIVSPRWDDVRRWRDVLRTADVSAYRGPLSEPGMHAAWSVALDALDDASLQAVAAIPGEPYPTAAMALARTVITAPLEWCAVLLGRGTELVLKYPRGEPGLTPLLVQAAEALDLPLRATDDRGALQQAELVIGMGSDSSAQAIRQQEGPSRVLAFGHRFSVAWITRPESLPALARDLALHDGRGCMSPVAVISPLPLEQLCEGLALALQQAEQRWPRGALGPVEAAAQRTRRALARVTGLVREGEGWAVHGLPPERFEPLGLPRTPAAIGLASGEPERLWDWLGPWTAHLSVVGTDDPLLRPPSDGVRLVEPGAMQAPPLLRLHDGVDWLRATLRV
jgi:hypothetical protein